jgi:hypothetical protein
MSDDLMPFSREIEYELREIVVMAFDFGQAMSVKLKLLQRQIQRLNFNFLNKNMAPGKHPAIERN